MKPVNRLLLLALVLAIPFGLLTAQEKAQGRKVGEFQMAVEAPCLEVLSQGNTGTCWSFATLSYLESEVQRINGRAVDLSEMFVVRHAILEKARRYVMLGGKAQFSEGGLSHDVIAMVKKYGIVPAAAYTGLKKGDRVHNHGELFLLLQSVLDKLIDPKSKRRPSRHWESAVAALADAYMGAPPKKVKTMTGTMDPRDYATKVLKLSADDYVEVMSYGYTPFHEKGELLVPDNWMRFAGYLNVPINELMEGFDHALNSGFTIAADMDVSERGFSTGKGVARLPRALEKQGAITQAVRDEMFRSGKTTDDHLMHVTGIAHDAKGNKYYYTKNSWGEKSGPFGGYLFISENFMRAKLLAFMVHQDGLPKNKDTDN